MRRAMTMKFALVGCCSAILSSLIALASSAFADNPLRKVPIEVTAAALNTDTGSVLVAGASENQVWSLPKAWFDKPNVAPSGPLQVPNPISVIFKRYRDRSYFLLACFGDEAITVCDASTLKIVAKVPPTPASPRVNLSSSLNPQDPWVYVTSANGNRLRLDAFRIDSTTPALEPIALRNQVSLAFKPSSGGFHVSANGDSLYGIDTDRRTITRWKAHKSTPSSAALTMDYEDQSSATACTEPLIQLPNGLGIAQGDCYWRSSLNPLPIESRPTLRAGSAFSTRSLVAGITGNELQIASLLTGALVARKQLPQELQVQLSRELALQCGTQTLRQNTQPIVVVDDVRDRIIVFSGRNVYVTGIADLKIASEAPLRLMVDLPRSFVVEEETEFGIKTSDPNVKVELFSAPEGMRLVDKKVVWKPNFAQLGTVNFSLRSRFGEATSIQEFDVQVTSDEFCCQSRATRVVLNDAGSHLLAWEETGLNRIEVIDLKKRSASAMHALPSSIIAAAMYGESIGLLTNTGNEVLLGLYDLGLNTKAQRNIEVASNVRFLHDSVITMTEDTVSLHLQSGNVKSYTRLDLTPFSGEIRVAKPSRGKPMCTDVRGIIHDRPLLIPLAPVKSPLGRHAQGTLRTTELQTQIASDRLATVMCDELPFRITAQISRDASQGISCLDLIATNADDGNVVRRWPIEVYETVSQNGSSNGDSNVHLNVEGLNVVVLVENRVYRRSLSELLSVVASKKFRLQPNSVPYVAKASGATPFRYTVTGGQSPYAFEVKLPADVRVTQRPLPMARDSSTIFQFELDYALYAKGQFGTIVEALVSQSKGTSSADSIVQTYVDEIKQQFEKITGQKPTGIPIAFLVLVEAHDAEGATEALNHYVLLDLPKYQLEEELNLAVARRWPGSRIAKEAEAHVRTLRKDQK